MGESCKFLNPEGVYFVSFSVVKWLPVFENRAYVDILIDTLHFSQQYKGLEIFAYCIMPDHLHLVFRSKAEQKPGLLLGDFKRFTSKKIVRSIMEHHESSQREYYLDQFILAGRRSSNVEKYQFWNHTNHPVELWSNKFIKQKINYVHNNPVKAGLVEKPEDYLLSSAIDYAGGKGVVDHVLVLSM
ncbi:MAG: transposase [Bacteroidia bacterium]|nr:transposase [Bacteroidia bacterium]